MAGESARDVAARSRAKAERLLRHAEMYDRGAEGEHRTAAALATLPSEWVSVHDLRWPGRQRANIDHIVFGPGGIFVIDSKNWSGRLSVGGETLRQNGRSRETAVAGCADAALAVAELLGPYAAHVSPVLCFAREEPVAGWVRDVMICSVANLPQMLLTRPAVLTDQQLADAWARLQGVLSAAHAASTPPRPPTRRRGAESVARPPARRRATGSRGRPGQPSLGRFLAAILMLIGMVLWGPQIATAVGGIVAATITKPLVTETPCPHPSAEPVRRKGRAKHPVSAARDAPASTC